GARWRGHYEPAQCSACHAPFSMYSEVFLVYLPDAGRAAMLCSHCWQPDAIEHAILTVVAF
ncbi:MAG TPA: hypothetical protein VKB76_03715, partial [Ktedonobacterales bacterium]|nr:hypothetical protein [Ktedonobacterales bacterium]